MSPWLAGEIVYTMEVGTTGRREFAMSQQLVRSESVQAGMASLFAQGLQIRGPLERDLGDRLQSL